MRPLSSRDRMRTFIIGWIAALGLCVGSFLTVVISRVPIGGSILSPPSACPRCGGHIRWYDNLPVLSWIALRGRCRHCGVPIAARYPLLELVVGTTFGMIALLARPRFVPALLATVTGAVATVATWLLHGRPNGKVAIASAVFVVLIVVATVGVVLIGSR